MGVGGGGGVSGLPRKLGKTEAGRGGGGCGDAGDETDDVVEVRAAMLARCRDSIGLESSERNGEEVVAFSAALNGRRPPPCGGGELEVILATAARWLICDHYVLWGLDFVFSDRYFHCFFNVNVVRMYSYLF